MSGYISDDSPQGQGYLFLNASEHLPTKKMVHETRPQPDESRVARYLDDLMRVTGNSASFGGGDVLEGGANSLIYGAPMRNAVSHSNMRTNDAHERLGPWVGGGASLAGGLAGYLSMARMFPWLLRGLGSGPITSRLTMGAVPLEGARGAAVTPGGAQERTRGALAGAYNPLSMVNPLRLSGVGASFGLEPAMERASLGEWSPSALTNKFFGNSE